MDSSTILLGSGVLLVIAGILGGGFAVKEIQVPKLGGVVRVFSTLIGFVLVIFGIGVISGSPKADPASPAVGNLAKFNIVDNKLADAQESEEVRILLDGKEVGTLSIDSNNTLSTLVVDGASPGVHGYTLLVTMVVSDGDGNKGTLRANGMGTINVSDGKIFRVRGNWDGKSWLPYLEESSI
jgi:hypothetical protein